jgi:hypothetical protein
MVIKGKSVAGAMRLAGHLGRTDTNERMEVSLPKTSIQLRPLDWQSPANQGMIVA